MRAERTQPVDDRRELVRRDARPHGVGDRPVGAAYGLVAASAQHDRTVVEQFRRDRGYYARLSDSGLAALYVRRYWEQLRNAGFLDKATIEGTGVTTTWLTPQIIATIVLAVLAVCGLEFIRY